MVSSDVTSLYMDIPVTDALNITRDYVNDDQFTRKTGITQDKFLNLNTRVLTTTWYNFNSQFYQQTGDVNVYSIRKFLYWLKGTYSY